jgi:hypothetical protein
MEGILKGDWQCLVGQTITAVVVCSDENRRKQVHLVFSDDTNFEIYTIGPGSIAGTKGVYPGDLAYVLNANRACKSLASFTA